MKWRTIKIRYAAILIIINNQEYIHFFLLKYTKSNREASLQKPSKCRYFF